MSTKKAKLWQNILGLFVPVRGQFMLILLVGLLSTGTSLVEPLIYREAINDIAGLFVKDARDKATGANTDGDEVNPITSFFEQHLSNVTDSLKSDPSPSTPPAKNPHTQGHVAGRTPQQALDTLLWAVGLLFLTTTIGALLRWMADNMNVRLSCSVEQGFISRTFTHVLNMPLEFFTKRSSAAVSKQINQQDQVFGMVNGFSQQILPELISLIGIMVIMFTQNRILTLIAFSIIPFYIMLARRSANKLELGLARYYEEWEGISARIQDSVAGIKTVKLAGAEERESDRLKKLTGIAYKDYVKRTVMADRYLFFQSLLTRGSTAMVLAYGGYLALERKLTPGDVVMFVAYLDRLYTPIDSLAALWVQLQQNLASIARAFKLTDGNAEEKKGPMLSVIKGQVEFRKVHFNYTPDRKTLKGVSFVAEPGKVTALVGPSGAGKTTTVDLLMKLYQPASGSILVDDQDINLFDSSSVRGQIGMVAADGAIFRGSLIDNIRYKSPLATEAEVKAAAISAGMEHTLRRLPDGLNTAVGEGGAGLSVGERQRIQIARILVSKPRILVLDEATANLDFATEAEVKNTITEISKEHTVIVIAHRYSMVRDADHVVVMSGGEVIEQGSPADLILKNGWFAGFANQHLQP